MSFIGEVRNGQIVFTSPIPLADGTRVRVDALNEPMRIPFGTHDPARTAREVLEVFAGFQSRNSLGGLKLRDLIEEGRP